MSFLIEMVVLGCQEEGSSTLKFDRKFGQHIHRLETQPTRNGSQLLMGGPEGVVGKIRDEGKNDQNRRTIRSAACLLGDLAKPLGQEVPPIAKGGIPFFVIRDDGLKIGPRRRILPQADPVADSRRKTLVFPAAKRPSRILRVRVCLGGISFM